MSAVVFLRIEDQEGLTSKALQCYPGVFPGPFRSFSKVLSVFWAGPKKALSGCAVSTTARAVQQRNAGVCSQGANTGQGVETSRLAVYWGFLKHHVSRAGTLAAPGQASPCPCSWSRALCHPEVFGVYLYWV